MKKSNKQPLFMTSVLTILFAQIAVKIMGLIYRLVITNIEGFGDTGNGLYAVGFQLYMLLLAISSTGIPIAVSRLVSEAVAEGKREKAHYVFKTAITLFSAIGFVFSVLLFFGADFIALHLIRMDGVQFTLQALAPSIMFVCMSSAIRGYFLGLNNVSATSRSQIIEQALKSSLTIVFVLALSAYSAEVMSAGANFATSVATVLSFGYLAYFYLRRRSEIHSLMNPVKALNIKLFWNTAKKILALSIPLSLNSVIVALGRVIDSATISRGIAAAFAGGIPGHIGIPTAAQLNDEAVRLAGMLAKSDVLINLPLALNISFATVLVPAITSALVKNNKREASSKISLSLMISVVIIMPCAFGMIALAEPIFKLIYPSAPLGYELLQISAVTMFFAALNQTISGSLQGLGKVTVPVKALMCGMTVKVLLNLILIRLPSVNIYGAAISSLVCHMVACGICFFSLREKLKLNLPLMRSLFKPLASCILMSATATSVYVISMMKLSSNAISVIISVTASVIVYFISVCIMKILSPDEVSELPFGNKIRSFMEKFNFN